MTEQELGALRKGAKVRYSPKFGDEERGRIKSFDEDLTHAFVVYNCAGNWDEFENYTAARTRVDDLKLGWND